MQALREGPQGVHLRSTGVIRGSLCKGVRFAKLVTTAYFTEPARSAALEVNDGVIGFNLDLVDIED